MVLAQVFFSAAYPMSFVYDKWVRHLAPNSQHMYMMTGGLLLGFANFGKNA